MVKKLLEMLVGKKADRGVTLAEMEKPPRIVRTGDRVEVTVWNSLDHSSLAVNAVEPRREGDAVVLRATQSLVTEIADSRTFTFTAGELGLDGGATRFAWADPDGTIHPLADAPSA
jgi:hypothetical protein